MVQTKEGSQFVQDFDLLKEFFKCKTQLALRDNVSPRTNPSTSSG
jgi:hypothetical protein